MESGGRDMLFFSGSLLTVAVVVVVVFCGVSCAPAEKTPIIRADTAKPHFTQFFTRKSSSGCSQSTQICGGLILCERRRVQLLNFNEGGVEGCAAADIGE